MTNKFDIDKYINEYKESLPPVHHTEAEDRTLMNSILSEASTETSAREKITSENRFSRIVNYIKYLTQKNGYRYSFGVAAILVGVGIFLFYNYKTGIVVVPSHQVADKQPLEKTEPEPQKSDDKPAIETTLLASIDCNSYRRSGGSPIDKKVIFGIIGKQLQKYNIEFQTDTNLITQALKTDSGSVILIFTYDQPKKSVEISSVSQKPEITISKHININMLIKDIKTTLQHKVRMLYE